ASGLVRKQDAQVLAIALHSMCAYPVLNAPMMCGTLRMSTAEYDKFLTSYAEQAAELLIRLMKK
ncbi:MAG TPA: hypothetical protein VHL57_05595, partial [Flavobacteriales bacterium]|nr:hypothetical protein [Flavobacteriales bacterium]